MESISHTVLPQENGCSVRHILKAVLHFSTHAVARLTRVADGIQVNGQHARTINELLLKLSDTPPEELLEEFLGHTPLQVACGALLGAAVAILYSLP